MEPGGKSLGEAGRVERLRPAIAVSLAVFLAGIVAGVLHPWEWILKEFMGAQRPTISFGFIFLHNLRAFTLIYLASIVYVGLALILVNGYVIGTAVAVALERGLTPMQVAAALLPHGVFEVPALLIASGAGLVTLSRVRGRGLRGATSVARLLVVGVALLAMAAFIEAYITPIVARAAGVPLELAR